MSSGSVTFNDLRFSEAGTYTIAFNADGHDEVVSATITVTDPPPAARPALGRFRLAGPVR
jgi:hypothetical protein